MKFEQGFLFRLKGRDEDAFTELYRKAGTLVYNYLLHRLGRDVESAADLLSEVFSDAITYAPTLVSLRNVAGWLLRIAKSKVVDYYRAHKKEKDVMGGASLEGVPDTKGLGRDPELQYLTSSEAAVVGEAFTALKPWAQEVLTRMYVENQTVRDISCAIGRSEKAVESLLYRARAELETKLARRRRRAGILGRGENER